MPGCKAKRNGQNRKLLEFFWHSIIILILSIRICVNILPLRFPNWGVTFLQVKIMLRWSNSKIGGKIKKCRHMKIFLNLLNFIIIFLGRN